MQEAAAIVRTLNCEGLCGYERVPKDAALPACGDNTASSPIMVAGARYTAEKKTPSRIIDFEFERERLRITAQKRRLVGLTCLGA